VSADRFECRGEGGDAVGGEEVARRGDDRGGGAEFGGEPVGVAGGHVVVGVGAQDGQVVDAFAEMGGVDAVADEGVEFGEGR